MATLAVKYRPTTFEDVCGQENIITILNNQLKEKTFKNCYLLCGPSGCGKTTLGRIFAKKLNNGGGSIIEIDAASNNGVDDVRQIIKDSQFLPLDGSYKVYIIDEVHMFSTGAFNAMLKLIEEPPAKTIFILCTTDPQKIPATILGRVQRYNLTKITDDKIISRLKQILKQENISTYDEASLQLIAKLSKGGMRDSISTMEKCLGYNQNLTTENISKALGVVNYDIMIQIISNIEQKDSKNLMLCIDKIYSQGIDLKLFIVDLIKFLLDLVKYKLCNNYDISCLPQGYKQAIDKLKLDKEQLSDIIDGLIKLNNYIKYESNPIVFIEAFLLRVSL